MRILFANNLCGHYGGVEQVIAHTARELVRRGHECHLAYGQARPDAEDFARPFASAAQCGEFGARPGGAVGLAFAEIVARVKPDVAFFHKVARLPAGAEFASGYRKAVMVHDHDLWCPTGLGYDRRSRQLCRHSAGWQCYLSLAFLEKKEGGLLPFRLVNVQGKVCEMRRYHRFDAILPNSTYIREKLLANGFPGEKTLLCHPVLNQGHTEPSPVPEEPVVLYVGSLIRGKGIDLLLRALSEIRCSYTLHIVGAGKSEPSLRALAKTLGISGAVHFAGWVPNEALARYYQGAKVVAVPSAWPEPFGLVGLEAMRHGRPVAAFRVGGIPDWLVHEETGLLAPPQDVKAYAAALELLLTDTGLARRMGLQGARRVKEKFSFAHYIERLEGFLAGKAVPVDD